MSAESLMSCVRIILAIISISSALYVAFWFIMRGYKLYKTIANNPRDPAE